MSETTNYYQQKSQAEGLDTASMSELEINRISSDHACLTSPTLNIEMMCVRHRITSFHVKCSTPYLTMGPSQLITLSLYGASGYLFFTIYFQDD